MTRIIQIGTLVLLIAGLGACVMSPPPPMPSNCWINPNGVEVCNAPATNCWINANGVQVCNDAMGGPNCWVRPDGVEVCGGQPHCWINPRGVEVCN